MEEMNSTTEHLERHSGKHDIQSLIRASTDIQIHSEVLQRIQSWFRDRRSTTLWICGPFQAPIPSRNTLLGASVVRLVQEANIPVLAYFARGIRATGEKLGGNPAGQELVGMVYTLVSQMLGTVQQAGNADWRSISQRCRDLDGSLDSLTPAIALLEEMIGLGPGLVFCVVDGIQDLAHRVGRDDAGLQRLLKVLQNDTGERHASSQVVKTMFTTDGFTSALAHLRPEERLDLSDVMGQNEAEFGSGYEGMAFLSL